MVTTLTTEPSSFYKGDNVSWTKTLADYPASIWTLTYYLRGASSLDINCTDDGDDHIATISDSQSAGLEVGDHWWQLIATKTGERKTIANGQLSVLQSLSDVSGAHDGRSHVKITLDNLNAMIENRATLDQQSYSIAGRSLSRMTPDEILKWRDTYAAKYKKEKDDIDIANGKKVKKSKVQVRFNT